MEGIGRWGKHEEETITGLGTREGRAAGLQGVDFGRHAAGGVVGLREDTAGADEGRKW